MAENEYPAGPPVVGIVLTAVLIWSLYHFQIRLAVFMAILLTVLSLGTIKILD